MLGLGDIVSGDVVRCRAVSQEEVKPRYDDSLEDKNESLRKELGLALKRCGSCMLLTTSA